MLYIRKEFKLNLLNKETILNLSNTISFNNIKYCLDSSVSLNAEIFPLLCNFKVYNLERKHLQTCVYLTFCSHCN